MRSDVAAGRRVDSLHESVEAHDLHVIALVGLEDLVQGAEGDGGDEVLVDLFLLCGLPQLRGDFVLGLHMAILDLHRNDVRGRELVLDDCLESDE